MFVLSILKNSISLFYVILYYLFHKLQTVFKESVDIESL